MSLHVQFNGALALLGTAVFLILLASRTDGFSYEDLPAVAMEYKVHIDAGKEDCYSQYVNPGATFYVSFQVAIASPSEHIARARGDPFER